MSSTPESLAVQAVRMAHVDAAPCGVGPDDAVRALGMALHAADIKLPDLSADGCTCGAMPGAALVDLGAVRADVALELASVIAQGAMRVAVGKANARSRGETL